MIAYLRRLSVPGVVLLSTLFLLTTSLHASSPDYQLVRRHFKHKSQLQSWVDSGLDVWQVEGDTALIALTDAEVSTLKAQGIELDYLPQPAMASFGACYRTYGEMVSFLQERQAQYPELFQLQDVGDSWETQQGLADRDIYVGRLTSPAGPQDKPKFLLVAEHHAREIITPKVALEFIDDLLRNYGQNPTITWLLDNREVWVIPMVNPDGHSRAVQEENWRKNTRTTASCNIGVPPNSYGVDPNRNYSVAWDNEVGASTNPCNLTYRGAAPFSEPETRAVRDLVLSHNFELFISLHSYGDFILYPWAHTWEPAPDAELLAALATRMAGQSGYRAMQATGIGYRASGDTSDWVYGELGIPSLTFEIGGMEDGFFWPPCDVTAELYQEVRPTLIYAALATGNAFQAAGGPEAHEITVEVNEPTITVRARVSDEWTGEDAIQSAEIFVETLDAPGTGVPMSAADDQCNSQTEWMTVELGGNTFTEYAGRRVPIMIVAEDATGKRGVPAMAWLDLRDYVAASQQRVQLSMTDTAEPTFEFRGGHVYLGTSEAGHVLMTVSNGRVYRGPGTTGALLYTLEDGERVRIGEAGPILYSKRDQRLYRGDFKTGTPLYRIDGDRLLKAGGTEDAVVLTANVNLTAEGMETVSLLLPVLMDRRF